MSERRSDLPVDLGSVELDPTQMFVRVPPEAIGIDTKAVSVSIGDVDLDGRPDILIAARDPILLHNLGDAGFEAIDLDEHGGGSASAITDMNADGRPDIVFGWWAGNVRVLHQTDTGFETTAPSSYDEDGMVFSITPTPDFNDDGFPDSVYLGLNSWPVKAGLDNFKLNQTPNIVLDVDAEGFRPAVVDGAVGDEISVCMDAPTFTSLFVPRQAWGLDGILYTGNDFGPDCLSTVSAETGEFSGTLEGPITQSKWSTMGADFRYLDDDAILLVSSDHNAVSHMTVIQRDGVVTEQTNRLVLANDANWFEVGWGVLVEPEFILVARGEIVFEDPATQAISAVINSPEIQAGGVDLYVAEGETYVQQQSLLPSELEGQRFFHIAAGDFYGNDGRGDGCLDAVVTPFLVASNGDTHPLDLVYGPSEFLLGTCRDTKAFVGVAFAPIARHIGAMVEARTDTGRVLRAASKTTSGVGGTADPRVRIPLPEGTKIERLTIHYANGTVETLSEPPLNRYLDPDEFTSAGGG